MKHTQNKSGANRLSLKKITVACLNDIQSNWVRGGAGLAIEDKEIIITTINTGGTFQSGYMGSNCNQPNKTSKVVDYPIQL